MRILSNPAALAAKPLCAAFCVALFALKIVVGVRSVGVRRGQRVVRLWDDVDVVQVGKRRDAVVRIWEADISARKLVDVDVVLELDSGLEQG